MKILIDSANIKDIKYLFKYYPIDGVTSNPTILLKENKDPYSVLNEIKNFIQTQNCDELHVQVISKNSDEMIEEAKNITSKLGKETYIKIPAIEEGLAAIKKLSQDGYNTTATAIYSAEQAFLAAKSGASYVAPYVNRIENFYGKGVETVKTIQNILKNNMLKTKILAASFKKTEQIIPLAEFGVYAATIPVDVLKSFLYNKDVDKAVDTFIDHFYQLCGNNSTM